MDKVSILSKKVVKPFGIFSQGVKVGNLIFVSGQTAQNALGEIVGKGDIRTQTKQCIENLKHLLEAGGATVDNVVKVGVYVADMSHLEAIHEVREVYFKKPYPASTLVQVSRFTKQECLIEIDAIAII
jgi:2-iminobutanoate/2-iminopropanoate deaminase